MNIYEFEFSNEFEKELKKFKYTPHILKKIDTLFDEIENTPKTGTGKPEPLKGYGVRSVWSRRIDQKHRLTYEIFEDKKIVNFLSCYGHYNDK